MKNGCRCMRAAYVMALFVATASDSCFAGGTPIFTPIPGVAASPNLSIVRGVSGDGNVVFGSSHDGQQTVAIRWTAAGGTTSHLSGEFFASSFDGNVLAGNRGRWTPAGWESLPLPMGAQLGGNFYSGISNDGRVIVGSSMFSSGHRLAVSWNAGAVTVLPRLNFSPNTVEATEVNADGSFIAGSWYSGAASAWATDGMTSWALNAELGIMADMTPDGRWAVGERGLVTNAGYRYDFASGEVFLIPTLPGRQQGIATGISADGNTIVGWSGTERRAYVWDEQHGTRDLGQVLLSMGADLQGFILSEARAISDDGRTIVGTGYRNGVEQGWVVVIPTPAGAALIGLWSLTVLSRPRRVTNGETRFGTSGRLSL